ncbi:MAG: CYTH domain-containing protein [Anaerovoracaceae bacterium]|jgi:triphosphatase
MEVELKYGIPDPAIIDSLWTEEVFSEYGSVDKNTSIPMSATYYDTEDRDLQKEKAAFRIRKEGDQPVATLKWNDSVREGVFEREELNINLTEDDGPAPALSKFAENESAAALIEKVGEKPLIPVVETNFTRKIMRIDTGTTIFEADLDVGTIVTPDNKDLDICELEIELYSGSRDELAKIGKDLAKRFGLVPGVKSKYQRGIEACSEK